MKTNPNNEKESRNTPVVEHISFLRLSWVLEKVGYLIMFTIVILALLGFFSNGILSHQEIVSKNKTVKITYEGFARNGTQTQWKIMAKDNGVEPLVISITDEFDNFYVIENVVPQSLQVSHKGKVIYFTVPDGLKNQWHTLTFVLRSKEWGGFKATVNGAETESVNIQQWIYP
ncbi:hypothetical protein [Serratia quinivorans]|uniref:hypothetical protein n=1 Tax=Serratia quinivorans TaxID=137545 RepID=UPI003F95E4F7